MSAVHFREYFEYFFAGPLAAFCPLFLHHQFQDFRLPFVLFSFFISRIFLFFSSMSFDGVCTHSALTPGQAA